VFFIWGLVLLILPLLYTELRRQSFETRRWLESDHPIGGEG
jgi:hypothetical protein